MALAEENTGPCPNCFSCYTYCFDFSVKLARVTAGDCLQSAVLGDQNRAIAGRITWPAQIR
eukprot:12128006-Heterocapsa_arctica.AAC.1